MGVTDTNKVATTVRGQIIMQLVQYPIGTFIPFVKMESGVRFQVSKPCKSAREAKRAGYEAIASRINGPKISSKALSWEIDYPMMNPIKITKN